MKASADGEVLKRQRVSANEKMYYHIEDQIMWPEAVLSFPFETTFRSVDADGKKINEMGNLVGNENQYKLVYLLKFDTFVKCLAKLQKMIVK